MGIRVQANGVALTFNAVDTGAYICVIGPSTMEALLKYKPPIYEQEVWELELSVRATNVMKADGIETIGQLVERLRDNPYALMKIPNCGKVTEREIKNALKDRGLSWGEEA